MVFGKYGIKFKFVGMVSFDVKEDTLETANAVLIKTHYFSLAEYLGGVESLRGHPSTMTHVSVSISREEQLKVGLTDSLVTLRVGVEGVGDLIEDLANALE